jgi:uncharacterized protein (DUF1778 family)
VAGRVVDATAAARFDGGEVDPGVGPGGGVAAAGEREGEQDRNEATGGREDAHGLSPQRWLGRSYTSGRPAGEPAQIRGLHHVLQSEIQRASISRMKATARRAPQKTGKGDNLMVRLDRQSKTLVRRVASLRGVSTSDYVRSIVIAAARRDLIESERSVISLSAEEQLAFWRALNEVPTLTPAQRRLGKLMRGEM